ncbi:MAG: type III pantothenate kinase [Bacteroidota bacterium]
MYLVADAGNTRIKLAVFDGGKMVHLQVHREWSSASIVDLLRLFPGIERSLFCAVREVPDWLPIVLNSHNVIYQELNHTMPLPIRIGYQTPETLGHDRIAVAAGAADQFPGTNVLAIDAGTALTMDLVTADGDYPGGTISPGLRMRFSALHQQTFSLPEVKPEDDIPLIGLNTHDAILAGVVNGMIYEVDNSINSLKNKYNDLNVILTGGDARYLSSHLKNTIFVNENLVLNGLSSILRNFSA